MEFFDRIEGGESQRRGERKKTNSKEAKEEKKNMPFFEGKILLDDCYLVDPASSHMLVSEIKPCMCQYKPFIR